MVSDRLALAMMQKKRVPAVSDAAHLVPLPDGQRVWVRQKASVCTDADAWSRDATQWLHRNSGVADMNLFIVQGIKTS